MKPRRARSIVACRQAHVYGTRFANGPGGRAQLIIVVSGSVKVLTEGNCWFVPAGSAVWLPAMLGYTMEALSDVDLHFLSIEPSWFARHPAAEKLVPEAAMFASPLLRNLVVALLAPTGSSRHKLVATLVLYELAESRTITTVITMPKNALSRALAEKLLSEPYCHNRLEDFRIAGAPVPRPALRAFTGETGLPFKAWRHRARVILSIARLSNNQSVTAVSQQLGFSSVAAFTRSFSMIMGMTPTDYLLGLSVC